MSGIDLVAGASVPDVEFNTAETAAEDIGIHLDRAPSSQLVAGEIGVMGGVDVIVGQREVVGLRAWWIDG